MRQISAETNFNGQLIKGLEELEKFAQMAKFPSHALILKNKENKFTRVVKGITEVGPLMKYAKKMIDRYGSCYVETDMRANYNPSRMRVIEKAATKLAETLQSECPKCKSPGFSLKQIYPGLLCSHCGWPTKGTKAHRYGCLKCSYTRDVLFPQGKLQDPAYCDYCNP